MVMVGQEPLEKEHYEEAAQNPLHGLVQGMALMKGMGNKVEQGHAEHEAGDKAHRRLEPRMSQMQGQQRPAARQRGEQHQNAVDGQCRSSGQDQSVHVSR
jgi:hypothetical protein